ncbi:hypothetical protein SAMN06265365_101588 [Tistlia consotensis]|uniref:Uncharacterized protein n=1 Tax=Tistlia consotensis USBA 355 TaxID=560819 RepID=A0A1Y6BAQ3_9PROT|nr:hypothetical protein [Tistlia consotensis]SME93496.1 hypothetical protein SAMN05428998_101587 [Tistlia consotensis USBA 355]SNR28667.1 hypothetical protein SAMN06265365_101588 [Tistlia consotensis]
MAQPDRAAGQRAAAALYRHLRRLDISHAVAFRAAVERCGQFCRGLPRAQVEAAAWQAVQSRLREERRTIAGPAAGPPEPAGRD